MYIAPLVSLLRSLDWFVIAVAINKHSAPTELTRLRFTENVSPSQLRVI